MVTLAGPSITGVASFADGSASAPSITNTGDTNTGVFFSATDEVAITTGGTQRFKVTASGIEIADGGNIGSASDTDAMSISSGGVVTFSASLQVKNGATSAGFIEFFEDSDNGTNKATLIELCVNSRCNSYFTTGNRHCCGGRRCYNIRNRSRVMI